jgi:hypothetical protein
VWRVCSPVVLLHVILQEDSNPKIQRYIGSAGRRLPHSVCDLVHSLRRHHLPTECACAEHGYLSFLGFLLRIGLCGSPIATQTIPRADPTTEVANIIFPHQRISLISVAFAASGRTPYSEVFAYGGTYYCRKHRVPVWHIQGHLWCPVERRYLRS